VIALSGFRWKWRNSIFWFDSIFNAGSQLKTNFQTENLPIVDSLKSEIETRSWQCQDLNLTMVENLYVGGIYAGEKFVESLRSCVSVFEFNSTIPKDVPFILLLWFGDVCPHVVIETRTYIASKNKKLSCGDSFLISNSNDDVVQLIIDGYPHRARFGSQNRLAFSTAQKYGTCPHNPNRFIKIHINSSAGLADRSLFVFCLLNLQLVLFMQN